MSGKKSLTDPPKNLKEAVDWILRVTGEDGMTGSSTSSLLQELGKLEFKTVKIIGINLQSSITGLASGLRTLIGYEKGDQKKLKVGSKGIGKEGDVERSTDAKSALASNVYVSAYYNSAWFTDVENGDSPNQARNKKKALESFFTAIEKIYEGLTELYVKCKTEWYSQGLGGSSDALHKFMSDNGFDKAKLNTSKDGNDIAALLDSGLKEFTTAYNSAGTNPSLDAFRSQLEQNSSTSPSQYPLSALYILATYVYVESTSPATPSFAGYSGVTALAGGAYGFNLGGLGTFMGALLA